MSPIETDALVIGAGPAGLFAVFELGLQDIRSHVVDSLPHAGGQCVELYADKPIYDIPSVAVCTGRDLTERLLRQIEPFAAPLHLGQEVGELALRSDGRFDVATSAGTRFVARVVVVAGGIGSFQPKRLRIDALAPFEGGSQLLYGLPDDAAAVVGRHVVVTGGDEPAVDTVLALARAAPPARPASVTLLHRRDVLQADPPALAALAALRESGAVRFVAGQVSAAQAGADGRLAAIDVDGADGHPHRLPADLLLVRLGLSPKLGPLAGWGLALERKQVVVDTARFETSVPGIFAVGDVNTYPGKKKLIVCGFHEATLAAFGAAARVFPDRANPLQYTTTSPKLQRLLGVAPG